jgi:hypothetical protein
MAVLAVAEAYGRRVMFPVIAEKLKARGKPRLYRFHSCLNRGIFGVFLGRVRARDMIRFGYLIRGDGWSSAPRSKSGN